MQFFQLNNTKLFVFFFRLNISSRSVYIGGRIFCHGPQFCYVPTSFVENYTVYQHYDRHAPSLFENWYTSPHVEFTVAYHLRFKCVQAKSISKFITHLHLKLFYVSLTQLSNKFSCRNLILLWLNFHFIRCLSVMKFRNFNSRLSQKGDSYNHKLLPTSEIQAWEFLKLSFHLFISVQK